MRIYSRSLVNYTDVNHFSCANQWIIQSGSQVTLYFQLVDLDQTSCSSNGLRYMPAAGSTMSVTFPTNQASLTTFNDNSSGGFIPFNATLNFPTCDPALVFKVNAVQASSLDPSIWSVTLAPTQIPNSGNVQFTLTQGTNIMSWSVTNLLQVQQLNSGSC